MGLFGLMLGLGIAVLVGLVVRGPVRWVKILTAVLVLASVAGFGALSGFQMALGLLGVTCLVMVGSMTVGTLLWSHPRRKTFQPTAPSSCPSHARGRVDAASAELVGLGFGFHSDQMSQWRFGGVPRHVFVRFFNHESEPIRAEIHALENPKVVARTVVSLVRDGRTLMTCDQQADTEHFPTATVRVLRVASASSFEVIVNEHRAALAGIGPAVATDDPVAAHLDSYHRWVDEVVENGAVAVRGEEIRVRLVWIPRAILSVLSAWFH